MDMELPIAILTFAMAFTISLFFTKNWVKVAKKAGLVGKDINKFNKPMVAEGGGIAIVVSFAFVVLFYIFLKTFYLKTATNIVEAFALLTTVLLAAFIGFVDDIIGWKIGLKQWQKPILTIAVSFPLAVISAGSSIVFLPFFGSINFGILFPLLLIPLGVVVAVNAFNMLAGYNGLEAGMGVIILSTLAILAYRAEMIWLVLITLSAVFALLAFLVYNWFPAKVFPGDSLTYSIGALIAVIAILGNMEKAALILFIPYAFDFFLPLRKRFKVEAFAKPNKDGSLELAYGNKLKGVYDFTQLIHWSLRKVKRKIYERDIVLGTFAVEIILAILVLTVI